MKGIGGLVVALLVVSSILVIGMAAGAPPLPPTFCIEGYKIDNRTGNGLENWTIRATNGAGMFKGENVTNATGYWQICNLRGLCNVTEVFQPGWIQVFPDGGIHSLNVKSNLSNINFKNEQPCGECDGKVTWLELKYIGSTQNANITVFQKDGNKVITVFDGIVQPGETFNFSGKDKWGTLGPEITIKVCSPIVKLSMNGGVGCPPPQETCVETKIHTSCSQPIGPGLIRGDFEVVAGKSRYGGWLCPLEEPPEEECGECDGKVNWLKLKYSGSKNATIKVFQKDGVKVFQGDVSSGGAFDFSGKDKWGTLGTDIFIYVNNRFNTKIHTSCSQPIGPGLIRGDFEVVAGTSRNGGELCPVTP